VTISYGAVLFFENGYGCLAFEGCARVNGLSGQGRFFAVHASKHVLMFGVSLANGFATWRVAISQSGCLPFGSLLANQRRQSAIRHRTGGLSVLKAASARVVAGKPTHNKHPAVVASPPLAGARSRLPWARMNRGRRNQCGSQSPEALASLSNVEVVTGTVCSRPVLWQSGGISVYQMDAKCNQLNAQRKCRHAKAKRQQRNAGLRVLNALAFVHQPNSSFNRDVNAPHCRPLTLALGFS
jgi:hypothetical protein